MELIDQHTKQIMEGCKERARAAGLSFKNETLEYIVTNRDILELSPKLMIPTLYDYWVHDVEVLKEKGRYELYPVNPYETVINTRPAISFYNDNNPDWLNVMIFYHVLGHIDFFHNNAFFKNTWHYDFTGQALSDKRLIAKLRALKGREVDYVIEFTRGIDNLVGYYQELTRLNQPDRDQSSRRLDFYFDVFLQSIKKVKIHDYIKEVEKYNHCLQEFGESGEQSFFSDVSKHHPEWEAFFKKWLAQGSEYNLDLIQFLLDHSSLLRKEEHKWMKSVMQVVRNTSLFFQPQIRTKILNEGWASYWHETLYLQDDRIKGHEVEFARVNAGVTTMPRVGLNPYALGMQLFYALEERADKGQVSLEFQRLTDERERQLFDRQLGQGKDFIFAVRENYNDFMFVSQFIDQDFVNRHNLFVAGKRLDKDRMVWQYYVKSRKADDYRQMVLEALYHPPHISIEQQQSKESLLYLNHHFEGKPLVKDFIHNTMIGIEYLWGGPVQLETSEVVPSSRQTTTAAAGGESGAEKEVQFHRVLYTVENRKLSKKTL
ncbi:SpoVR family protein [candidate division CSSED10-310 bacterium]|uniref:SpoVR family protein n=1 Tax=candidate division CSSED10-310 bacterium TaxID=2855610 RepID=A0ABV6Z3A4_UNCC1